MASKLAILRNSCGSLAAAGLVLGMMPAAAAAQDDNRIERLETQLRALQRAVFPGGDERYFEPEITAGSSSAQPRQVGAASSSALTDVLTRLDAIEAQVARLTATTEVNENALALQDMRITQNAESGAAAAQPSGVIAVPDTGLETSSEPALELVQGEDPTGDVSGSAVGPTPERLAGVSAVAKPVTDDEGDDEYVYGFRLWDAGFLPEAQQQLALFVEQYPEHWRTTYGRNLLGRAYLDSGEPRRAATHFFENYQGDGDAARAPDSLLYLSQSMIELGDTRRACIALSEFGETYPALATGRLQDMYETNSGRVDCD